MCNNLYYILLFVILKKIFAKRKAILYRVTTVCNKICTRKQHRVFQQALCAQKAHLYSLKKAVETPRSIS